MTPDALAAYAERIALPAPPTVDAAGLLRVQHAHRLAIPFENLDVRLGRPIAIDGAGVFDKMVTGRRGGFCFEHNRLFLDALAGFGFEARPLLAQVWLGVDEPPPLTHALALVTLGGGERWIADAGFGGSYAPPMRLVDGAEATAPDGARFRLSCNGDDWMLWRDGDPATTDDRGGGAGWQRQYGFGLAQVEPADLAASCHRAATAPDSRFVRHVIVSLVLPRGFARLTDRSYRRRAASDAAAEITDPRVYRMRLSLMFGIDLSAEEVAALGLF